MRRTVYVETSILSYLAGRPSRDLIVAARQQRTHTWAIRRAGFELYVSQIVIDEAAAGDPGPAATRAGFLAGLPMLDMPDGVADLAAALVRGVPLPRKAAADAAHIAVAAFHRIDFLLTWNLAHMANAELRHESRRCAEPRDIQPRFCARRMNSWEKNHDGTGEARDPLARSHRGRGAGSTGGPLRGGGLRHPRVLSTRSRGSIQFRALGRLSAVASTIES